MSFEDDSNDIYNENDQIILEENEEKKIDFCEDDLKGVSKNK